MNNFQDKLNQIEKELNLKKEESNGQIISSVSSGNRDNSGRSRNVYSLPIHKEKLNKINNKGGNRMISAEAAKGDIAKLIKEAEAVTSVGAATIIVLKSILVAIKVILTTRTNTAKIMEKLGIPLDKKEVEKSE